jgi:aminomethyltransferase
MSQDSDQKDLRHTPFYGLHLQAKGKIVDFAGWALPIHYGSQMQEHHQVRQDKGLFDVSHMMITDCEGEKVKAFLQYLLANDVAKLVDGKALYSCLLNEAGGIIDDLIVYRFSDSAYRIVSNGGTRDSVRAWLRKQGPAFDVKFHERDDLAMLAVQGPHAIEAVVESIFPAEKTALLALSPFHAHRFGDYMVARTGYTGEDGFEILLPVRDAQEIWQACLDAGMVPCGLGARDTLRLEAGMNLYGTDMTQDFTPLDSGLAWTVAFEPASRDFIGRDALTAQKAQGDCACMIGLVLEGQGVMRHHQKIYFDNGSAGEITSGGFSPTLEKSIALARVTRPLGKDCEVDIRGKRLPVRVVKYPFVRQGKSVYIEI